MILLSVQIKKYGGTLIAFKGKSGYTIRNKEENAKE